MTDDTCDCLTWATDMRVGLPNGHNPRCPRQPRPSHTVKLSIAPELITEWLRLPGAKVLDANLKRDFITEPGVLVFDVHIEGAPSNAVSMEPVLMRYGNDCYLSQITWLLIDGTTRTEHFDRPVEPADG